MSILVDSSDFLPIHPKTSAVRSILPLLTTHPAYVHWDLAQGAPRETVSNFLRADEPVTVRTDVCVVKVSG